MLLYARYLPGRRVLLPASSGNQRQKLCHNSYTGLSSRPCLTRSGRLTDCSVQYQVATTPSLISIVSLLAEQTGLATNCGRKYEDEAVNGDESEKQYRSGRRWTHDRGCAYRHRQDTHDGLGSEAVA